MNHLMMIDDNRYYHLFKVTFVNVRALQLHTGVLEREAGRGHKWTEGGGEGGRMCWPLEVTRIGGHWEDTHCKFSSA